MKESFERKTKRDLYFKQLKKELQELIDPKTSKLSLKYSRHVPCPVCRSKKNEDVLEKNGYNFVRCKKCGLVYANPQVQEDLLHKCYSSSRANDIWMDILLSAPEQKWRKEYFKSSLNILKRSIPKTQKIMDIGCGVGHFLEIARKNGCDVSGIELNKKAREHCVKRGLKVCGTPIEDLKEHSLFDSACLFGVLEHLNDPVSMLKKVRKIIRKYGGILIVVPNVYSFLNLFLREKAATFDGRNHLLYFSMQTLVTFVEKCGFKVVHKDTVLHGIDNVMRYVSFYDPYFSCLEEVPEGIPQAVRELFLEKRKNLKKWIIDNDLGLRLRLVGKKV